jgi:hypothetical protein
MTDKQKQYISDNAYTETTLQMSKHLHLSIKTVRAYRHEIGKALTIKQAKAIKHYGRADIPPDELEQLQYERQIKTKHAYMARQGRPVLNPKGRKHPPSNKPTVKKEEKPLKLESVESGGTWVRRDAKTLVYRKHA